MTLLSLLIFFLTLCHCSYPPSPSLDRPNVPAQHLTCSCIWEEMIDMGLLVSVSKSGLLPSKTNLRTHPTCPSFRHPWFTHYPFPVYPQLILFSVVWKSIKDLSYESLFLCISVSSSATCLGSQPNPRTAPITWLTMLPCRLTKSDAICLAIPTCFSHVLCP